MGITVDGIKDPLPQSTGPMEFYDIGTSEPYAISGEAISQRKKLVEIIRKKEKDSNTPPLISIFWKRSPTHGSTG